ncbi:SRPBCC family protein [Mesonia sp. MT50]|uniref:SRPBCC family protein n=1 Tax=Mesonia profundi TaxID=3070998 RepID=A0ABU0ZZQ3_9FLAO|nr:SRPBCC family protein [Mesonia profundi]MDQ7916936.1 SRPBCC family protein [Mesonia profundi]
MHLESEKNKVNKSQEELFNFLTEVKNYESIMPDSIQKFEVKGEDSFLFQLKGMPEIKLLIKETTPFEQVVLGAKSEKLPFTLTANIAEIASAESEVQLVFDGEFNSMMAMMIKIPLKNFINALSENMAKL